MGRSGYPQAVRNAVTADLSRGVKPSVAAARHGVGLTTVYAWRGEDLPDRVRSDELTTAQRLSQVERDLAEHRLLLEGLVSSLDPKDGSP